MITATGRAVALCARGVMAVVAVTALASAEQTVNPVIPPGQEALLASMLGGRQLPEGCTLSGARIEKDHIEASYACAAGTFVLTLRHPSAGGAVVAQTRQFAVAAGEPAPPRALLDAVVDDVRANEAAFKWLTRGPPPPTPPRAAALPPVAAAHRCLAIAKRALDGKPLLTEPPLDRLDGRDLYECQVVATDDVTACGQLQPEVRLNCHARWRFFHDARRVAPNARWPEVLAPALRTECDNPFANIPAASCAAFEHAVATQDPSACPADPTALTNFCSALASSDPARCGDGDQDCAELAGRLLILVRGGLHLLAHEGTERDQVHARAALDGITACAPVVAEYVKQCIGSLGSGPVSGPSARTGAAASGRP